MEVIYEKVLFTFFATTVTIIFFFVRITSLTQLSQQPSIMPTWIKGGISYDKFWATELNYSKMTDVSLLAKLNTSSDFFRCKQCHAWDLLGSNGSYINRGPKQVVRMYPT